MRTNEKFLVSGDTYMYSVLHSCFTQEIILFKVGTYIITMKTLLEQLYYFMIV